MFSRIANSPDEEDFTLGVQVALTDLASNLRAALRDRAPAE